MKAAVIHAFGEKPHYQTFDAPTPKDGQVRVRMIASAVSPRTRSSANGSHYTGRGALPIVPGIDGVGRLDTGELVYFIGADDKFGTLAECTVAERAHCVDLPKDARPAVVAAAMIPAISSWVALASRVPFTRGQRVLVLGATGTAGRMAVSIAKHLGAGDVVAAGRASAGLDAARGLGADVLVPLEGGAEDGKAVAQAASEVDVVLDYMWGSVAQAVLPQVLKARRDEARALYWVEIGSLAGDEVALSSVFLRKRNLHLLGSGQGSVTLESMLRAGTDVAHALHDGVVRVDTRVAPLADIETLWDVKLPAAQRLVLTM